MVVALPSPPAAGTPIQLDFRGAARELFHRRDPEVLLAGPSGTGKTVACCWKLHLAMARYPGARALLARKTGTALAASAVVTYREQVLGTDQNAYRVTYYGGSRHRPPAFEYDNGSVIVLGSFDDPEKIKSSEFDLIYLNEATELTLTDWEMAASRLRHGVMPYQQLIADCNPAGPNHWLKRRCDAGTTLMLISRHEDNPWLYDARRGEWTPEGRAYLARLEQLTGVRYRRLRLGEWAAEVEGALWHLDQIEEFRVPAMLAGVERVRVVVAVDPPGSHDGAECGIVVVARGSDGHLYVLADVSRRGTPLEWATAAVAAYDTYEADAVVIEVNQGGEMATETLHRVRRNLPIRPVRATRGKVVRAEPVSALAAQGRIHHVGRFVELEDQLTSWVPGQPSPDRLDALVWAVTDLLLSERRGEALDPLAITHNSPWNAGGERDRPWG
jgi:phage terminase large subunit-like protein